MREGRPELGGEQPVGEEKGHRDQRHPDQSLLLLSALAAEEASAGVPVTNARLAERVGLDQAQVSRMLNAFIAAGLVERDSETRGYRVGGERFGVGGPGAVRNPMELFERNQLSAKEITTVADSEFEHDVVEFSAPAWCEQLDTTVAVSVAVPKHRIGDQARAIAASVAEAGKLITSTLSTANPTAPRAGRPAP